MFYAHAQMVVFSEHAQDILHTTYYNRMRNAHNFIEEKHEKESLHLLQEWKSLQIKDSDYKNHHRFLRCLSKDLIPVSVKLESMINIRRAKQVICKTERQLLQDRVKTINSIP